MEHPSTEGQRVADEKTGQDGRAGPFQLGGSCEEVGPELGSLHEARHVGTGRPALTLLPSERMEWQPEGEWRMTLTYQPEPASVSLEVERAPASAQLVDMANILVLMAAAVERVEHNPRVQAHFAAGRVRPWAKWGWRAVAGIAVLALGLGAWLQDARGSGPEAPTLPGVFVKRPAQSEAPSLINTEASQETAITYPLPYEPFRNQAKAPCRTKTGEVEINGGCWIALEKRPPCFETQAEYQGKCYMPVSKDRGGPPQSVQP